MKHQKFKQYRLSGDIGVGLFEPADVQLPAFSRLDPDLLRELRTLNDVSATASDVLDELGLRLALPTDKLPCRLPAGAKAIGHALTLTYLPERHQLAESYGEDRPPKLAHHVIFRIAERGDVLVIDGQGLGAISVFGGRAAAAARAAGLSGAIIDGGVRDLDTIRELGFPVWSRHVTPVTGKARAEATSVNRPIRCGDVQVIPGDLVLADATGICFVPNELLTDVVARIIEVSELERSDLANLSEGEPR